ncbi:hypothetical protein, partial [Bradyrhizobium sp. 146]
LSSRIKKPDIRQQLWPSILIKPVVAIGRGPYTSTHDFKSVISVSQCRCHRLRRSAFEAMIEFVTKDRAPNHDEPRMVANLVVTTTARRCVWVAPVVTRKASC